MNYVQPSFTHKTVRKRNRFRKWSNRLSVYSVAKNQHRSVSDNDKEIFVAILDEWISSYAELLLFREQHKSTYCIDWSCIQCKTLIVIDSYNTIKYQKPIPSSAFYCDKCRPKKMTVDRQVDPILIRYIGSFYSHMKQRIKANTNTLNLSDIL